MEPYSYKYAIPYLIFLGYLIVLMFAEFPKINKPQSTKRIRMLTMAGFLFFFGLRGFVYTDWYGYYPFFEEIGTLWNGKIFHVPADYGNKEMGFILYSVIIKSIYPSYFFWVFVSTAIDVILLNIFFRRYAKYYVLGFIMFFLFGGIEMEMNLMRNIKSILLFMLSLRYVQERKMLPYMLLNGIGILFHFSAILYLPLYFMLHREFSKKIYWSIFIVGSAIFLLHIAYLQPTACFFADLIGGRAPETAREYFRLSKIWEHHSFTLGSIERWGTFILSMLFLTKLRSSAKSNMLFVNLYVLYFICFYFFAEVVVLSERVGYLFICAYYILLPNLFALSKIKDNKKLIIILLIAYAVTKTTIKNSNIHSSYDNIVFGIQTYEKRVEIFQKTAPALFDRSQ